MQEHCQNCRQKDSCGHIYEKLGRSDAPPVFWKIFFAMVLPLILLVAVIAAADKIFADKIAGSAVKGLLSAMSAAAVIAIYICILKIFGRKNH